MFWPKLGKEMFTRDFTQWGWLLLLVEGKENLLPIPCNLRAGEGYSAPGHKYCVPSCEAQEWLLKALLKLMLREQKREKEILIQVDTHSLLTRTEQELSRQDWWLWRVSAVGLYLWGLARVTAALFSTWTTCSCAGGTDFLSPLLCLTPHRASAM